MPDVPLSPAVFEQFWLVLVVCGYVAVAYPGPLPNRYLQAQEAVTFGRLERALTAELRMGWRHHTSVRM